MAVNEQLIKNIRSFESLLQYLQDDLDWPLDFEDPEDAAFDYSPEDLDLDAGTAAKIESIRQLRPLTDNQPWGIFYVEFERKRLPVTALRRILRSLVEKKRSAMQSSTRPAWKKHDLLFVSSQGEAAHRSIAFAHFKDSNNGQDLLQTFSWDARETQFFYIGDHLNALRWPDNPRDVEAWREQWSAGFTRIHGYNITTAKQLSVELARLARSVRDKVKEKYSDGVRGIYLKALHKNFKEALVHDMDVNGFADAIAQTVAYGLFAARFEAETELDSANLAACMPGANVFLRDLFGAIQGLSSKGKGGLDLHALGITELIATLNTTDVTSIKEDFGRTSNLGREDPVIYFYEDFLREYDKEQKVRRGEFYTPKPVVRFIVRSVDEILRTEFGLADGLADTATWGEMAERHEGLTIPEGVNPDDPFVQILDPATGTGTFLEEVIAVIAETIKAKWRQERKDVEAEWNAYVPKHLLPRLNGFELNVASYAIAHVKLGLKLKQTGYNFASDERLRVFLTNTLEAPAEARERAAFLPDFLSHEALMAEHAKARLPITVLVGNPPYSNFGQMNKGVWVTSLIDEYKIGLSEKKLNLDDDFVKFVRYGHWRIEKSHYGIMAMITNHTYLDGITHRRMRQSLASFFDHVRVLDLGGSKVKPSKTAAVDDNVFDIRQGVAIGIFNHSPLSSQHHIEHSVLEGTRGMKYAFLQDNTARTLEWTSVQGFTQKTCLGQFYFFANQNTMGIEDYCKGYPITHIFPLGTSAVQTKRDGLFVDFERSAVINRFEDIARNGLSPSVRKRYPLETSAGWSPDCLEGFNLDVHAVRNYTFRPFDFRCVYYDRSLLGRARYEVMRHMLQPNISLTTLRQTVDDAFRHVLVSRNVSDINLLINHHVSDQMFPLYIYTGGSNGQASMVGPNVSTAFVEECSQRTGLSWQPRGSDDLQQGFGPENVLHYVYAVLHSPIYRELYAPFLRIDFPRVPLTAYVELFRALCGLGQQLVGLHLMEATGSYVAELHGHGDAKVDGSSLRKPNEDSADGRVRINKTQQFAPVPPEVWRFQVGGYQVCHKWLKDRKGRTLSAEDITHYGRIVAALGDTIRLMAEIDEVIEEHGGWPDAFSTGEG